MAKKAQKTKRRSAGAETVRIGIIGGSGLYNMPGLEKPHEVRVKTPFGDPSDALVVGSLEANTSPSLPGTLADTAFFQQRSTTAPTFTR